jgi:hypothetical protein
MSLDGQKNGVEPINGQKGRMISKTKSTKQQIETCRIANLSVFIRSRPRAIN